MLKILRTLQWNQKKVLQHVTCTRSIYMYMYMLSLFFLLSLPLSPSLPPSLSLSFSPSLPPSLLPSLSLSPFLPPSLPPSLTPSLSHLHMVTIACFSFSSILSSPVQFPHPFSRLLDIHVIVGDNTRLGLLIVGLEREITKKEDAWSSWKKLDWFQEEW